MSLSRRYVARAGHGHLGSILNIALPFSVTGTWGSYRRSKPCVERLQIVTSACTALRA
jgi:hypothetical protein